MIWSILNTERLLGTMLKYFQYRGKDWEDFIISKIRGFQPTADYLDKFRIQPCAALMAMIHYRTSNYTKKTSRRGLPIIFKSQKHCLKMATLHSAGRTQNGAIGLTLSLFPTCFNLGTSVTRMESYALGSRHRSTQSQYPKKLSTEIVITLEYLTAIGLQTDALTFL